MITRDLTITLVDGWALPTPPRAPRLGTPAYEEHARTYGRVAVRPIPMHGPNGDWLTWRIDYPGAGPTSAVWPRYAHTLAEAIDIVHASTPRRTP